MAKDKIATTETFKPEIVEIPDLNAIQVESYEKFLDRDLDVIFRNSFPITSQNGEYELEYHGCDIDRDGVKFSEAECKQKGRTLGVPVKAKIALKKTKTQEIQEKDIFFGDFPLMTKRGTFVINGAERVVVSQLVRSPGAIYGIDKNSQKEKENRVFYMGTIYPYRGTKLELCLTRFKRGTGKENGNIITVSSEKPYGDSGKKTTKGKLLLTFFLRLLGDNITRNKIIASFYRSREISTSEMMGEARYFAFEDVMFSPDESKAPDIEDVVNTVFIAAGSEIDQSRLDQLKAAGIDSVKVIDTLAGDLDDVDLAIVKTLNTEKVRLAQILIKEKKAVSQVDKANCQQEAREIYERKENGDAFNRLMAQSVIESFKSIVPQNFKTNPPDATKLTEYLRGFFLQGKGFNLGVIGRRKLERKFEKFFSRFPSRAVALDLEELRRKAELDDDIEKDPDTDTVGLSYDDIIMAVILLLGFYSGEIKEDDQDSLSNRRVWTVGEQLQSVLREAFGKMTKSAKEKMGLAGDNIKPHEIISIKPIVGAVKEFFGSSQLSQFMDQINPLAALTHRRRLTSLGPRGIGKDAARQLYDTRSVNPTHYGRICPVETPEGSNIGLILSLALYAKVDKYGFLITPYRKVINSYVTSEVQYFEASDEEDPSVKIAPATTRVNEDCHDFLESRINVRSYNEFQTVNGVEDGVNDKGERLYRADEITHMDVSRAQILSPSAALVPFIQYADPHRILMAVNEYRQAVPLLYPEEPHIRRPKNFEIEKKIAFDSGVMVVARHAGTVTYVSSQFIRVRVDNAEIEGQEDIYELIKYQRTNQDTCFNQKPIVNVGDHVEVNDVLADGPSTKDGELALGQTMICGYISIEGKNHEDTMLVSKELEYRNDKSGLFESVHIKEFTVDVRDTKLGVEKLTRDIPNTSEKLLMHLDSEGIVALGTHVKQNDVLVGKVTPKGETDLTPEQKLINSIFGEKSKEVKNSSLTVPHGTEGIVIGIHRLKKDESDELQPGVEETIKVVIAEKRDILRGDKFAGRFGNKGVFGHKIHQVDMPVIRMEPPKGPLTPLQKRAREIFDGKSIEATLDPLGIISRMNDGALIYMKYLTLEKLLGKEGVDEMAPFEAFDIEKANSVFREAGLPEDLKFDLYDGRTGEKINGKVFVGVNQYIKLNHLVDDKMHARSTGPYSIVTQQPLGGRAMFGGQRVGEMEVWAFEAYGAANTLQELLTIKSDDMEGRTKVYESIVKGGGYAPVSLPESFNVLVQELRGLALDMSVYDESGHQIPITEHDSEIEKKAKEA